MYLENTTLAPKGSGRETKIVHDLVIDIACTMAIYRHGDDSGDWEYHSEAERLLRLFIAKAGRYPHDALDVGKQFPGCFKKDGIKPRPVS
jgi:hypothetical protein